MYRTVRGGVRGQDFHLEIHPTQSFVSFLNIAAKNVGVDSCWVNFFDPEKLKKALTLPENEDLVLLLDLGYRGEGGGPLLNHTSRKPLVETVRVL